MLRQAANVRKDARERVDESAVFGPAFEHRDREVEQPVRASARGTLLRRGVGVRFEDVLEGGSARLRFLDRLAQQIPKLCADLVYRSAQVFDNAVDAISDCRV